MSHKETEVDLPPEGIVLVTGHNGAGKSSLYEAVACSMFGKTIRGTQPWPPNKKCLCEVHTDVCDVVRTHSKGKTKLTWSIEGEEDKHYETTTKATKALEEKVGTFDLWRRTHVFSLIDVAAFTTSTDSERKRFLESILDLSKLDKALKACKNDLSTKTKELDIVKSEYSSVKSTIEEFDNTIAEIGMSVLSKGGLSDQLKELDIKHNNLINSVKHFQYSVNDNTNARNRYAAKLASINIELNKTQAKILELESHYVNMSKNKHCVTCGLNLSSTKLKNLLKSVDSNLEYYRKEEARLYTSKKDYEKSQEGIVKSLDRLNKKIRDIQEEVNKICQQKLDIKNKIQATKTFEQRKDKLEKNLLSLKLKGLSLTKEIKILTKCEEVLNIKGLRSYLLSTILTGIESISNNYLSILSRDSISIALNPYKESKTGSISDSIDIKITGAGGSYGYKAASAGERRRIDIAILLSLADISSSTDNPGTLWFDEVLDSLDYEGRKSVIECLNDLSHSRNIVLISHSDVKSDDLDVAMHLDINNGKVTRVT